jgi:hypothetical protein
MKRTILIIVALYFGICFGQSVPELKIGGVKGATINTDELVMKGITCAKQSEQLISFHISAVNGKVSKTFPAMANRLSDEFVHYCRTVASGTTLRFDSMKVKSNGKIMLLPATSYLVKRETPHCNVGNFSYAYELSADEILSMPYLNCFSDYFKVVSFDLLIANNEKLKRISCSSARFSSEIVNAINLLNGGETIWFENIKAVSSDHDTLPMPPVKLAILGSNKGLPCTLNGISFGIWDKGRTKTDWELKVPDKDVEIQSFTLSVYGKRKNFSIRQTAGNKLTAEMKDSISHALPGTVVRIEYIKAEKAGLSLKLNPIFFRVGSDSLLPKAVVGNLSFGEQSMEVIRKNPKVTVNGVEAKSFIIRTPEDNIIKSENGVLSEAQLQTIENLPKGTVLQFYNIYAVVNNKRVSAEDIWVKIK